ncbi:hypothetical protein HDV02_006555 [Globomyces sp. JEL0801]|nr:hypothetical protein HDV02_006555 [Globomyces sp. JEL0801]
MNRTQHSSILKKRSIKTRKNTKEQLMILKNIVPQSSLEVKFGILEILQNTIKHIQDLQAMSKDPTYKADDDEFQFHIQMIKFDLLPSALDDNVPLTPEPSEFEDNFNTN